MYEPLRRISKWQWLPEERPVLLHIADELALPHGLARTDRQRQAVGIDRGIAAGVADDHRITIARTGTGLVITRLGHGVPPADA